MKANWCHRLEGSTSSRDLVLAPDHIGLTIQDQPCLYWYVSKPIPYPIELTVIEKNAVTALPSLSAKLKVADRGNATYIYAEEWLWYDALGSISGMIKASPNNVELRKQRASLLEQVGLTEVANFENRR